MPWNGHLYHHNETGLIMSPNTACALIADKGELTINMIKHFINTPDTINIPTYNTNKLLINEPTIHRLFEKSQELIEEVAINSRYSLESQLELQERINSLEQP